MPLGAASLVRLRKRVGQVGMEKLLAETIEVAKRQKLIQRKDLDRVNVDTTVQEKAIAFPTDARLYHKARVRLVREADKRDITLRQSYPRLGKRALARQGRYAHARQMRRAARETRKLRTYLGWVMRDVRRKAPPGDAELERRLALGGGMKVIVPRVTRGLRSLAVTCVAIRPGFRNTLILFLLW